VAAWPIGVRRARWTRECHLNAVETKKIAAWPKIAPHAKPRLLAPDQAKKVAAARRRRQV
jgi:hypothetical protein